MSAKHLVVGTIVGGIVLFAVGHLVFNILLADFYTMTAGTATGVDRVPPLMWAVALAALSYGALVTLAVGSRGGSPSVGAGVAAGAVAGFLIWFTADFTFYGITNISNLTQAVVDPVVEAIRGGIAGGAVAFTLSKAG